MTERHVRRDDGLEQIFEIDEAPGGEGPLLVELSPGEGLSVRIDDARSASFVSQGRVVTHYGGLAVQDATGADLPAHFDLDEGRLEIVVDDRDARYPIVVDPLLATQHAFLVAGDAAAGDGFGPVAIDGDTIVAGAPFHVFTSGGTNQGSAYVYARASDGTWVQQVELWRIPVTDYDRFGECVTVSGDALAIGAPTHEYVFVFRRTGTTWSFESTLTRPGGFMGLFGRAMALQGDTLLVGADSLDTRWAGSAYVFVHDTAGWILQGTLAPSDILPGGEYAFSVALDGDTAVVGAISASVAYVFTRTGGVWSQQARLTTPGAGSFGASAAVSGDTLVIGARTTRTAAGASVGAAYAFVRTGTTWALDATLVPDDGAAGDWFGDAVALDRDVVLVSSPRARGTGVVYVFSRGPSGWRESGVLAPSTGTSNEYFGLLALSGRTAVVGAPGDTTVAGTRSGSASVFDIQLGPGDACTFPDRCSTGHCVDGVCCDTECGAGVDDCQACSQAGGGVTDGVCGPLTATAAAATTCRPAVDACDAPETCDAASTVCPHDVLAASGVTCRPASGPCDAAESCDGTSPSCPPHVVAACPDGGALDGGASDAALADVSPPDAASTHAEDAGTSAAAPGCGCRAAGAPMRTTTCLSMLVALGVVAARRRRRP